MIIWSGLSSSWSWRDQHTFDFVVNIDDFKRRGEGILFELYFMFAAANADSILNSMVLEEVYVIDDIVFDEVFVFSFNKNFDLFVRSSDRLFTFTLESFFSFVGCYYDSVWTLLTPLERLRRLCRRLKTFLME